MENKNTAIARRDHQHTKHSPTSVQPSRHRMDWANRPSPFKEDVGLKTLSRPVDLTSTGMPASEAMLAQLEAEILGNRIYLLAFAWGKGATGLTFFDDLVVQLFSPAAASLDPIFVVSCGVSAPPGLARARMVRIKPGQGRD